MKGSNLGEFEEIVLLTVAALDSNAYGVSVKQEIENQSGRKPTLSAVHAVLNRLQEKGFLDSEFGSAGKERGGKRKRLFKITNLGKSTLYEARQLRDRLWDRLPDFTMQPSTDS